MDATLTLIHSSEIVSHLCKLGLTFEQAESLLNLPIPFSGDSRQDAIRFYTLAQDLCIFTLDDLLW